ncbi:protogenin-like [Ruditapes philippinarum]|uniref:protogenin-like n=1 Tax=Ruditapes philippinarum TaxID=129788 RepID=UPI00295BF135|nr:protogenin-like [Ruditapes philippinarum]
MCVEFRGNIVIYFTFLCVVLVSGEIQSPPSSVIVQPSANTIEVLKNSRLAIDCPITSEDKVHTDVSWTKDGVTVLPQKRVYVASNGSLIIEKFLNKRKKSRDDTGFYECYATNSFGTFIGRQVEVKVAKPTLRIEPENINVITGGVARFQCQIESASPKAPFCVWEHPRQDSQINRLSSHLGILQLYNVSDTDGGKYTCRYFTSLHSHDVLEKSAFLSVHSGHLPGTPTLLNTPQNLSVISGTPALLECLVEGGQNVKISWRYSNGSDVRQERGKINLSGRLNLQFSNTIRSDAGTYQCVVQHAGGIITRNYSIKVKEPPKFIVTPLPYFRNVLAAITRLTCEATGNPKPTVQWYKNGLKIYPAPRVTINPQLILYGRLEDTGYYQCIANNSLGINVATSFVIFERQPNTPDIVTNVTATSISSHEVNVTWSPADTPDGFPIVAYMVNYQFVHDLQCPGRCWFQTDSEREVSKHYFKVIDGLKPYTKYRFAVQCISGKGASSMSKSVTVRTLESVPTGAPDVRIIPDSSTSFRVSWTEIPESERNGWINRYQLSYGTKDKMITVIQLPEDTKSYLVTGLESNSEYVVKVLAGNSQGFPDIDNWISYRTPVSNINESTVPSLTFEPLNSSAVSIIWKKDSNFVGSYRVVVQKLLESGPVREFNITADTTRLDVAGLEHKVFYKIDFMKRDERNVVRGYVTELYQCVGHEGEMEPPPPYIINPESRSSSIINLSWEKPKTRLNIVKYTVKFQRKDETVLDNLPVEIDSFTTYITLDKLQPFSWYAVAVQSHTTSADGPFSKPVIVQTKEGIPSPPEILRAEVVSPGTVKLKWGPPKQQNGIITSYIIYYNSKNDVPDVAWSFIHQNASHTSLVLEDLKNEVYYFKLRACTNAGAGNTSRVIMIDTLDCNSCPKCKDSDSCPGKNEVCFFHSFTQIFVIVTVARSVKIPILAQVRTRSVFSIVSHRYLVSEDLKNEVYYFKLRSCTNAGAGNTSRVIMIDTLDCNSCPKCKDSDSCPEEEGDSKRSVFEQRLGIIIGCAVGLVCIVICITFVIFKQREMRSRYQNRPRTELACRFNPAEQPGRYLGNADTSRLQHHSTYSPMLRRMLENTDYTYKAGNEQRALLSPSSTGSVNNPTVSTSNTESCDTTPCSSDFDIVYHPIKNGELPEKEPMMKGSKDIDLRVVIAPSDDCFMDSRKSVEDPVNSEADSLNASGIVENDENGNLGEENHFK